MSRRTRVSSLDLPEAVVLGLRLAGTWDLFGIDEMPGAPVALNESPRARDVHGVPTISESVVLEANPRLVARRLAVALDHHAVQAGVTAFNANRISEFLFSALNACESTRARESVAFLRFTRFL